MGWNARFAQALTLAEKDLFDTKDPRWVKIINLPLTTYLE